MQDEKSTEELQAERILFLEEKLRGASALAAEYQTKYGVSARGANKYLADMRAMADQFNEDIELSISWNVYYRARLNCFEALPFYKLALKVFCPKHLTDAANRAAPLFKPPVPRNEATEAHDFDG